MADKISWHTGGLIIKNKASAYAKAQKERGHTIDGRKIHARVRKVKSGYVVNVGFSKGYKTK
jgi:hypothetical protein